MFKNILKYITISFILVSAIFLMNYTFGEISLPGEGQIQKVSMDLNVTGDIGDDINSTIGGIIRLTKVVLQGLLVIFIVYVGIQMILSMGSDEDKLNKGKTQLRYSIIAIIFINIPGALFESFYNPGQSINGDAENTFSRDSYNNLFFNSDMFEYTLKDQIIGFLEVGIFAIAIIMIILAGLDIIKSAGKDDQLKKGKTKIMYSVIALIFVSIIEALKTFAFGGKIDVAMNIFKSLANLMLYFAAPVGIFFLSLAGYYLITSNGDEEKSKKAKSIVINVLLGTLILLAAYTFLLDISNIQN